MNRRSALSSWPTPSLIFCGLLLLAQFTHGSWVDPDTPKSGYTIKAETEGDDRPYHLVFSDEFEQEGRNLEDGTDPRWTAINKNDYTNRALHFYSKDNVLTENGVLNITTIRKVNPYKAFNEKTKKYFVDKKYIQSGMVQSWNKFCFIGGIVEFKAKLPGDPGAGGLWPALWMLGNLARGTYVGSSDFVWPYSYSQCDPDRRQSQMINACSKRNHYGMEPFQGRGSPEIDIIEAMQGIDEKLPNTDIRRPYQSASLQIAPGIERDRPNLGELPHKGHWYTHLEYGANNISQLNPFFYGSTLLHKPKSYTYQADGLSANFQLNKTHYNSFHTYRIEWEPPEEDGSGGYIRWYTDNEFIYGIKGESLKIVGTEIPTEPMYLLMNTAVSDHWGFPQPCPEGCECKCFECDNPDCACGLPTGYCDNFPAAFEIEHVRIYQPANSSKHFLGCSPPHRPTELWIKGHERKYMEEGDKRPLEPLRRGGGVCSDVSDCGGSLKGECSAAKTCVCKASSTGPNCLAHAGYYDFDNNREIHWDMSQMIVPKGAVVMIALLLLGFLLCVTGTLRNKLMEKKYQRLANVAMENSGSSIPFSGTSTYQNPASTEYALPPSQKVVTYCVIDGRLVDQ